ncbi:MAG: SPFH domain-containing protein [Armatimonadetes bacterium]|nr:SPFH domain-containing protein [Armatimonadota bacterium]
MGNGSYVLPIVIAVVAFALIFLAAAVRILREYERAVVFRLGRLIPVKGPGLILLIPIVDRMERISTRIETIDVQRQEVMTRDNVPVTVDAVVYYRVMAPADAVVKVQNFHKATYLIAQTTLRSVLGQSELDELLSEREKINQRLQEIIDEQTEPWGIKVSMVEVRDVVLPDTMKRAMARQAEVERERRAKVINAEGEYQAAQRLQDAAKIIAEQPIALQLRFLQTLSEVATENNSTMIFPVPIDLFAPYIKNLVQSAAKSPEPAKGGSEQA